MGLRIVWIGRHGAFCGIERFLAELPLFGSALGIKHQLSVLLRQAPEDLGIVWLLRAGLEID